MMQVQLRRIECSERGTMGALLVNDQFVCMTLERPWRSNMHNISCIPSGSYLAKVYTSSKHGETYKIHDVPGRTGILFHKGNEIIHSTGCILLGQEVRPKVNRLSLINSTVGFMRFITVLERASSFAFKVSLV